MATDDSAAASAASPPAGPPPYSDDVPLNYLPPEVALADVRQKREAAQAEAGKALVLRDRHQRNYDRQMREVERLNQMEELLLLGPPPAATTPERQSATPSVGKAVQLVRSSAQRVRRPQTAQPDAGVEIVTPSRDSHEGNDSDDKAAVPRPGWFQSIRDRWQTINPRGRVL